MRRGRLLVALTATCLAAVPAAATAGTVRFGSSLSVTPTLDTANGDHSSAGSTSGPEHALLPDPHAAEDTAIWNTALPGGGHPATPTGGQVTSVRIKGCTIEDHSAPSQLSAGTPVNDLVFQALAPKNGSWTVTADATGGFDLPFCSSSANPARGAVSTSTITTFHPIHLCVARGDTVSFHDIGGFIPAAGGKGPWYPQGAPFDVLARVSGANLASYVGLASAYGPGSPGATGAGFATESGEEVTMQLVEGTGGDAYGLCPGGSADEPSKSNHVICDYGHASKGHKQCGAKAVAEARRHVGASSRAHR